MIALADAAAPAMAIAAAACALLLALGVPFARRLALVDRPGAHKTHAAPVPTLGGPAIVFASAVALAVAPRVAQWPVLALSVVGLLAVGIWDDRHALAARWRFAAQIGAALAMIFLGDIVLDDFGALLWPGHVAALGFAAVPATVFCAVGVMNAMNMIDGMDGLAGSIALLTLIAIAGLAATSGHPAEATLACVAAAATLAFVAFNLRVAARPARVYLGNGGSLALGITLAWLLIGLSQEPSRAFAPVDALWLLAVPLVDTVSVMWRRLAQRTSPFGADHQHVHHLLQRAGFSVPMTLAILATTHAAAIAVGLSLAAAGVPESLRALAFVAIALVAHAAAVRAARRLPALRGREVA